MDTSANSVPEPDAAGRCRWLPLRRTRRTARASSAAFSLIEVAMAVGIMGFAFVAILGLVPVALTSFRDAKNTGVSSQVSEQIIAQAQVAPFTALTQSSGNQTALNITSQGVPCVALCVPSPTETPASSTPYVRYFNDQGVEVPATDQTGSYQVNSRVLVGPPFAQSPSQSAATGGTGNADVAALTVQVAYNPGRMLLDMTPGTDLWAGTANNGSIPVPIVSFQTNVARNF